MIWVIIVAVAIFIAIKIGSKTGEAVSSSMNSGGMKNKYSVLIEHILSGHPDCKIILETRTYIRLGVSSYGGTILFHIQQSTGGVVLIDYEVTRNPAMSDFTLHFSFPDNMDQNEMFEKINMRVYEKMSEMFI